MAKHLNDNCCEYGDCIEVPRYDIVYQVLDGAILRGSFCDACARVLGTLHHIIRVSVIPPTKGGDNGTRT